MFSDRSPVKPSITHTNAVLKVCALVGDTDAMYGVAAKLPTKGKGAPDRLTFTIILNAIKNKSFEDTKGENVARMMQENQKRVVMQGRRMWEEIRDRWSKGDLLLDEELVCALGRLLLIGHTPQDYDDILSLLELTMCIPRQIAPLGHPDRHAAARHSEEIDRLRETGDIGEADLEVLMPQPQCSPQLSNQPDHNAENDIEMTNPFAPLPHKLPVKYLVRPGVNTLSLALEACTALRLSRPAQDYWGLLTSPEHYNIAPDRQNYHVYLRLLRFQRASKHALEIVEEMNNGVLITPSVKKGEQGGEGGPQVKTFRIALSCCARDKKNRNALGYATRLVKIMTDTFETPDPRCLTSLLETALGHQPQDWRVLKPVVRSTFVHFRTLRSMLVYGLSSRYQREKAEADKAKMEAKELVKSLIGAYDVVLTLGREGMKRSERQACMEEKARCQAWLTRQYDLMRQNDMRRVPRESVALPADGKVDRGAWREDDGDREGRARISSGQAGVEERRGEEEGTFREVGIRKVRCT